MTKYFLHGGRTSEPGEENRKFTREFFGVDKDEVNILLVYFARSRVDWAIKSEQDQARICQENTGKTLNFKIASEIDFLEQTAWADVIYLSGGDGVLIKNALSAYKNITELFSGKTILASSAGVNVLAKYYYDNDYDRIEEGLGLLNIKTLCHFGPGNSHGKDYDQKLTELKSYGEDQETLAIPEQTYVTLEE